MTEALDVLRILARDGGMLNQADRAALVQAADDFERMQRELVLTQSQLIEANAHRIAMGDVLLAQRRAAVNTKPLSMSTGWVKVSGWVE